MRVNIPRIVLGGVSSGVGKTTVTVALTRALRARGLRVALFKCGPDYLDPTYHARAAGTPCQNLDGWMMGAAAVRGTFLDASRDADIALIEGVMGLFDGATPSGETGSTAEIAKWLQAPVALVVDAGGMARSIAALAHGYASFDPDLQLRGVIANRVGSQGHVELLRAALAPRPLWGGLPRDTAHSFAERHLGLHSADEDTVPEALLDHWGQLASSWLDVDGLLAAARAAPPLETEPSVAAISGTARRCRIGVAQDAAFHFYYADNLRRLEALGAELVRFSPISDTSLPDVDGLYLGGGYPEVHAAALSANHAMLEAIRSFVQRGAPVYAECGGLMYLTRAIVTRDGTRHEMVGLLPSEAKMCDRLQALGYVEVVTQLPTILGPAGSRFRGHQFRYSQLEPALQDVAHAYALSMRRAAITQSEGYCRGQLLASYVHAHWASNPEIAAQLVASCERFGKTNAS
jgi:cobyrinic acid a,c-diamide synthase